MTEFGPDDFTNGDEIRVAQDSIDLLMLDLMREASAVPEWSEVTAFNFIRRAYLKGKADGIQQVADEIDNDI